MNERIRQLAEQAELNLELQSLRVEKFAELIVEECVAQCWTVSELESKGFVVSECAKKIRKHFGVAE
jgi:hypothetical protein